MDIQVLGRVGRKHFDRDDRVLRDPGPEELADLVTELCTPYPDSRWWTHATVGHLGAVDGLVVVVAPVTGYVALEWTGDETRSSNPQPFPDAPLLPDNGDDDPHLYWPRSAYLPAAKAKKALAEHLVTGKKPTSVLWQPWAWEVRERPRWLKPEMPEYDAFHLITD
jgi:hypothetical protein